MDTVRNEQPPAQISRTGGQHTEVTTEIRNESERSHLKFTPPLSKSSSGSPNECTVDDASLITGDVMVDMIPSILVDVKELQELLHGNKLFLDNQQIAIELFYGLDEGVRKAILQKLKLDLRKLSDQVHLLRDNGGSSYAPKLSEHADGLQGKESITAVDVNDQTRMLSCPTPRNPTLHHKTQLYQAMNKTEPCTQTTRRVSLN